MSFVLDTNLISEVRRGARGDVRVLKWYDAYPAEDFFLSVMTTGEIRKGIEELRSRDAGKAVIYEKWLRALEVEFGDRILPVTAAIADIWGRLLARGTISSVDALIAATAGYHGYTIVTRNTRDFQRCGVDFVNPFEA